MIPENKKENKFIRIKIKHKTYKGENNSYLKDISFSFGN